MPERSASSIAFTLVLTVYFFGLAERSVKASPLQWQDRGHYREAKLNRPLGQASGFSLLSTKAAGVEFTNRLARVRMVNSNLLNGAGVAAGDIDGDGLCDLYFCRLEGGNELYLNRGGWRFQLAAEANGAAAS